MEFTIDIREACNPKKTGKGLWAECFVRELLSRNIPLTLLTDRAVFASLSVPAHAHVLLLPTGRLRWHVAAARLMTSTLRHTTYISPASTIVPALVGRSARVIPIIHDLIAFRREPHDRKAVVIERCTVPRAVATAQHLCTLSDATARDLLDRFPRTPRHRVTTIGSGPIHEAQQQPDCPQGIILCAGTLCPRKNQLRLIAAHALLPEELRRAHPLVLAGSRGWHDDEIVRLVASTPHVRWVGYVDDLEQLYRQAAVIACPSLYEGFGLPALTGLQRGIPVLTSDRGSLLEVVGNNAEIVDALSVTSIRDGLLTLLTNADRRRTLREGGGEQAKRHTWKNTVDRFLAVAQ